MSEPDFHYTAGDALIDGEYVRIDADLVVTRTVAELLPDPAECAALARGIRDCYRAGVYADPPDCDPHREADAWLAMYRRGDRDYWVQSDAAGGLVVMRPEDY
jgi:hypothetical protein